MGRRGLGLALALVLAFVAGYPRAAFAQEAPAAAEPPPPKPGSGAATAVQVTGYVLMGLGMLTMFASGIVFLDAAGAAGRLDDECPNKRCVEGSEGAKSLETARDTEEAADVLLGVSLPVITAGVVMVIYSGGFSKRKTTVRVAPAVTARSAGGAFRRHAPLVARIRLAARACAARRLSRLPRPGRVHDRAAERRDFVRWSRRYRWFRGRVVCCDRFRRNAVRHVQRQ
jgi:hypothetical protein